MLKSLLEKVKQFNPEVDSKKLEDAFEFAKKNFDESELSFEKSMRLVDLMLDFRPDEDTLLAAIVLQPFLNEAVSDEQVRHRYSAAVLEIVSGIRKLQKVDSSQKEKSSQLEVFRKMFLAMAKNIRVILLALVYRLYVLSNIDHFPEIDRKLYAKETLEVYVPVAARMGIYRLKVSLEDLAFKYRNPQDYESLRAELQKFVVKQQKAIEHMKERLQGLLLENGVDAQIDGRFKSLYSIYRKMQRKSLNSVNDLYDVFAMRIVMPSKLDDEGKEKVEHLYTVLGLIHSKWKPLSKRFKDYIAIPKPNGYRSLHTVVLGLTPQEMEDRPVEIQIRSENMHKESEYGQAAHWLYKTVGSSNFDDLKAQSEWLKGLENFDQELEEGLDIFSDRIFVLTPRGEVKDLPAKATPIDFAYSVHTDVGNCCVGAKVNGQIVSLDYELNNGDVVEVLTKKDSTPRLQWISFVKTDFARSRIKAYFSSLNRENNLREGRRLINTYLARLGKAQLDQSYSILKNYLGKELNISEREHLVQEVGKGSQAAGDIVRKIFPYEEIFPKSDKERDTSMIEVEKVLGEGANLEKYVLVGGESDLPVKFASCCKPRYQDKIFAYITRGNKMTIHKASCALLDSLNANRIIHASWKGDAKEGFVKKYRVGIKLSVVSRMGLIRDVSAVISSLGVDIVDIRMEGNRSGLCEDYFVLELTDLDQFDSLLSKLEGVKGVVKVVKE